MWYDIFFTNTAAIAVAVVVCLLVWQFLQKGENLPPGPRPWPVVGNMLLLRGDSMKVIGDLRKQYGDVYRLYLGNTLTVFVHGQKAVREVLLTRGEEFVDRAPGFVFADLFSGKGLVGISGDFWKQQRRFALHTLRDFGLGKKTAEERIVEEIEVLLKRLEDVQGPNKFSLDDHIRLAISNIINSMVFGRRFSFGNPNEMEYLRQMSGLLKVLSFTGGLNNLPWLRHLPGDLFHYKQCKKTFSFIRDFIHGEIREHKKTLDPENPRDYIDAYLIEQKAQENSADSTFSDDQLVQVAVDLFIAGTDTTATALLWAFLFLINHPEVQNKLRAEIHSVVGKSRLPCTADRKDLPYTMAVMNEVLRLGDIAPLSGPRSPKTDTTLCGYTIPKRATLMLVLNGLHQDSQAWENPRKFDPDRFLDANGKVANSEYFLPFAAGKRNCIGESLARVELFLFLTAILQRFYFRLPKGVTSFSEEPKIGLSSSPYPYQLTAHLDV